MNLSNLVALQLGKGWMAGCVDRLGGCLILIWTCVQIVRDLFPLITPQSSPALSFKRTRGIRSQHAADEPVYGGMGSNLTRSQSPFSTQ
eukprot:3689999-Rhodomonas_salina.4